MDPVKIDELILDTRIKLGERLDLIEEYCRFKFVAACYPELEEENCKRADEYWQQMTTEEQNLADSAVDNFKRQLKL